MIEFRTLGQIDLRRSDGREIRDVLTGPRRIAFLSYLAIKSASGFQRRDTLLPLFWPEHDREHARSSLRSLVHVLRRSLGEDVLLRRGDEDLAIDPRFLWCDVVAFSRALSVTNDEEALDLYGGDLLPGLFVSSAKDVERWVEDERTELRRAAATAACALANKHEREGNRASAAYWWSRAATLAPYDEEVLRRTMNLFALCGDRSRAVALYRTFTRRLAQDLEMEPTQAMRTLAESLRQGDARSVNPRSHGIERPLPESHPTASDSLDTRGLRLTSSRSGEASGHHVEGARGQGQTQWGDLLGRSPGVLVLPFKLNDRQPDPSSCRFADVLSRSLEAIGRVRVLGSPGLVCEEKHYGSSTASVDEIVAAGRRAGAGHVVVGAFVSIRQTARLWAQIYDVQLGQRGGWTRVEGDSGQVFQLVDLLCSEILRLIADGPAPPDLESPYLDE